VIDFILGEIPDIKFGLAWIFLALGAWCLNTGRKRAICIVYAAGLALEIIINLEYKWFGVFEDMWRFYYGSIILIDITVLLFIKARYFHRDYVWVRRIIFLTLLVNATIIAEWASLKTSYVFSQRGEALHILNWTLLLILFGNSDGNLRIMDKLWSSILGHRINRALGLLRLHVGPS